MEEDGYIDEGRKEKRRKTARRETKRIYTYIYRERKRKTKTEREREKEENRGRWWFVPQGGGLGKEDRIEGMITFVSYLTLERAG